jgi:hypothetical protein
MPGKETERGSKEAEYNLTRGKFEQVLSFYV